jgi:hypothetical protein
VISLGGLGRWLGVWGVSDGAWVGLGGLGGLVMGFTLFYPSYVGCKVSWLRCVGTNGVPTLRGFYLI